MLLLHSYLFLYAQFKIMEKCTLPVTGLNCVDTVVTEKAVFKKIDGELVLTDIAEEYTLEEIHEHTGFRFNTVSLDKI